MKKVWITLLLLLLSLKVQAFDSILAYENNAQEKMNFGYMGTIDNCLTTKKIMTVLEYGDLKNTYIPKVQSPDEPLPEPDKGVYNRVVGATAARSVGYVTAVATLGPFALLALGVEYITMIDICTNAYIVQPHEYVNRDILGMKCEKDSNSGDYFFETKDVTIGGITQKRKPFKADEVPFYYTCDPKYNIENPGAPLTDERQIGRNYGYLDRNSKFCTGILGDVAKNPNFIDNIGGVVIEFVPGVKKFFSWFNSDYGEPCDARLKVGPLTLKVDGSTSQISGYSLPLYDFFAHYKFDYSSNKIKVCVVAPYTLMPLKIGCSQVAPPAAISPVDPFIEEYLKKTSCSYFMNGRVDLESLGNALNIRDDDGNNKEFVKNFLKSEFHLTSTVTSCVKDMLYQVFIDSNPYNDNESFFVTVRDSLRGIVFATLVLYVAISGISLVIDPELYKKRGEMIMLIIKFSLVFYFAVGDAWYQKKANGEVSGMLPALMEAPAELTSIIFSAYNQNDPIGFCRYKLNNRDLFEDRTVSSGDVSGALTHTHGVEGVKMTVFDLIDCKLVNYFNFGSCRYDIGGIVLMWISSACFWTGGIGWLLGVVSLVYLFLMMLVIFRLVHVFILSLFMVVILVFFSPIFVLFALFKQTNAIFQTWVRMILGYTIYPAFSFVFVSFMLASLDLAYYGALDKNDFSSPGGGFNNMRMACQNSTETSVFCTTVEILGHDNPCYNRDAVLDDKFLEEKNLFLFKVKAMKREVANAYFRGLGKLLLFAFLFYLLLNSMLQFIAIILGVWSFSSFSQGGMNLINPIKAIFGGKS